MTRKVCEGNVKISPLRSPLTRMHRLAIT